MADSESPLRASVPKTQLFRARALEAIDSREGLDELMTIVPSRSLYALVAICSVLVVALVWGIFGRVPVVERGAGVAVSSGGASIVPARADGILIADPLPIGTTVSRGRVVARVRTPALESSPVVAPVDGTIVDVFARANAAVKSGEPIVTVEPAGVPLQIVGFVDFRTQPPVTPGMRARVTPVDDSGVAHSPLRAHVVVAAPEPATAARVAAVLGSQRAAGTLSSTLREVTIGLDGGAPGVAAGSPYEIVLVTGNVSPLAFLFPRER